MTTPAHSEPPRSGNSQHRDSPRRSTSVAASLPGVPRIYRFQKREPRRDRNFMAEPKIQVYLTDWCPYCARAKGLLESKGAQFEAINIEERPEARADMMARSGRRSVPQIFIGDTHGGGV